MRMKVNSQMTDNRIGVEGVKEMGEMMKVNTTITELNLRGDKETERKERRKKWMNDR